MPERDSSSWGERFPAKPCKQHNIESYACPVLPHCVVHEQTRHSWAARMGVRFLRCQNPDMLGCKASTYPTPGCGAIAAYMAIFWWSRRVNCSKMSLSEMPKTRTAPT